MATLIRPPAPQTGHAPIESVLELTHLRDIEPNLFTNTRPLWRPPGARGIYGGAVIAQCLAAAQRTVPDKFVIHSMHCYFVLAGNAEIPVIYHVERVRQGRSFATRTVQARQRGGVIFTVTMSFTREDSAGTKKIEHAAKMPQVPPPVDLSEENEADLRSPFVIQRIGMTNENSPNPEEKKVQQWFKARGTISEEGGHEAHLNALAYMTDSSFIGTVAKVHKVWRFGSTKNAKLLKRLRNTDAATLKRIQGMDDEIIKELKSMSTDENGEIILNGQRRPELGMMVSLDHTIYFHEPKAFRADEWMFTEMESPWAGDGRGLVLQKIFTKEGKLIATCVQEVSIPTISPVVPCTDSSQGLARLVQDDEEKAKL